MVASTQSRPSYSKMYADMSKSVSYIPTFARLTGSVTAAVLLQQIVFRWEKNGCKPFYKFRVPCEHNQYRAGDSWCEELAFTPTEFDSALDRIGTKITQKVPKSSVYNFTMPNEDDFDGMNPDHEKAYAEALVKAVRHIIAYWTDGNRVTHYDVNTAMFDAFTELLYKGANSGFLNYIDKSRNLNYLCNQEKPNYLYTENNQRSPEKNTSLRPANAVAANDGSIFDPITEGDNPTVNLTVEEGIGKEITPSSAIPPKEKFTRPLTLADLPPHMRQEFAELDKQLDALGIDDPQFDEKLSVIAQRKDEIRDALSGRVSVRAITIKPEYAQRIMTREKQYEIRNFKTDYRGTVVITLSGEKVTYGLVDLVGIYPANEIAGLTDDERAYGQYAWRFENPRYCEKIPVRGQLGLWMWDHDLPKVVEPPIPPEHGSNPPAERRDVAVTPPDALTVRDCAQRMCTKEGVIEHHDKWWCVDHAIAQGAIPFKVGDKVRWEYSVKGGWGAFHPAAGVVLALTKEKIKILTLNAGEFEEHTVKPHTLRPRTGITPENLKPLDAEADRRIDAGSGRGKTKPKKPSAYGNQDVFNTLGEVLFYATDQAEINAVGGRIGPIREALIDHIFEKRKMLFPDETDLAEPAIKQLVCLIEGFGIDWDESNIDTKTGKPLTRPQHWDSFGPAWIKFCKSERAKQICGEQGKPTLVKCEACGGRGATISGSTAIQCKVCNGKGKVQS